MPGYEAAESSAETLAIEKEIRDFLNSFDWKNASDYEKAVHVARRVNKAEYDNTTSSCNLAYGCLVEGKALCDGFVNAANLLAWCTIYRQHPLCQCLQTIHIWRIVSMACGLVMKRRHTMKALKLLIRRVPFSILVGLYSMDLWQIIAIAPDTRSRATM